MVETVDVETEWDPADGLGETRYATGLAARHGWPSAIVAQAWLDRPDAGHAVPRHRAGGLSHAGRTMSRPRIGFAGIGLMGEAMVRRLLQ